MEQLLEFAGNHPLLITAALVTGSLLVFNELRLTGTARFAVSPDQAVRLMNKGALVLDLRGADAYAQGHLAGARNVELGGLDASLESFGKYRGKPVIAYCERGVTASRAVAILRRNAFEHAYALRGGLTAWRQDHLPLEKSAKPVKRDGG